MDDEDLFGPVAYRLTLSDAIDLGLLADYQILVPVVTDEDLRDWLATGPGAGVDGLRLAGRQVAALRAIHDHKLRRVLTFHHRVADARAFATTLHDTAATLPAHLRPESLWADWISGHHAPQVRRRLLLEFASHTTPDTPAVLSNARVLGEGIDVPAIDAVVFADPKNSPVDTVQAVGRALRQQPGAGKKATLVVPVYLTPDEDPDDLLGADAYTPSGAPSRPCAPTTTASRRASPTPAPTAPPCPPKTPRPGSTSTAPPRRKKSPSPCPCGSWHPRAPNGAAASKPPAATTAPTTTSTSLKPTKTSPATHWAAGSPGSATSTPPAPSTQRAAKHSNASVSSGTHASRRSNEASPTPPHTPPATATSPPPSTKSTTPSPSAAGWPASAPAPATSPRSAPPPSPLWTGGGIPLADNLAARLPRRPTRT